MVEVAIKSKYEKGLGIVSATKLTTYRGCPLAYYLKYIEPIEVPQSPQSFFGQAIHYMLDQFYKRNFKSKKSYMNWAWYYWDGLVNKKFGRDIKVRWSNPIRQKFMFKKYSIEITDEQAIYFAEKGYRIITQNIYAKLTGYPPNKFFFKPENQIAQFKKIEIEITKEQAEIFAESGLRLEMDPKLYALVAMKILSDFYEKNKETRQNVLFHEKRVTKEFEGYTLLAKFDRIDKTPEGIEIIDYKSGKDAPDMGPEIEFMLHHHPQFTQYSKVYRLWQASEKNPLPNESRILLYHLRSGKLFETKRSDRDYEYLYQLIRTVDRSIREGDFTPFYGFHCKWCDYLIECNKRKIGVGDGMSAFIERIEALEAPLNKEDKNKTIETILNEE